jgi:hypothetical protein
MCKEIERRKPSFDTIEKLQTFLTEKDDAVFAQLDKIEECLQLKKMHEDSSITLQQQKTIDDLELATDDELMQLKAFQELCCRNIRFHLMKRKIYNEDTNEVEGCMIEALGNNVRNKKRRCLEFRRGHKIILLSQQALVNPPNNNNN